jgi:enoyl-CoA hydratase
VIPGLGGTQRLARRLGVARARELIYTGDILTAEQARQCGLVNAVLPASDLMTYARKVAGTIASRGPLAVAAAKRTLRAGEDQPLSGALAFESEQFARLFATADQKEGMRAFLEKRPANFQGQ